MNCVVLLTPVPFDVVHPPNVYPVLVGCGRLIVPPFQLAVNVWLLAVVTFVVESTLVLPLYHPPKFHVAVWLLHVLPPFESNDIVYDLVGLGNAPYVLSYVTVFPVSEFPPVAPL